MGIGAATIGLVKGLYDSQTDDSGGSGNNAPPPPPPDLGELQKTISLAKERVRKRMQSGEGRNDTIKTLGLGDIPNANLERKTLLGY